MIFSKLTGNTNEIHQEDFFKVIVLKHSTKGQWQAPSAEHTFQSLQSTESEQNEMLKQFGANANEIYSETFSKLLLQSSRGKEQWPAPFV